jgi:polyhydroxyalkanoate synthase subunit PhaC
MEGVTAHGVLYEEGSTRLIRFAGSRPPRAGAVALLVPSLINRWYVLDLRDGASLAAALVDHGIDTFCLDWGVSGDEDRDLGWDQVVDRVRRALRRVRHAAGVAPFVMGYCLGATLSSIALALDPGLARGYVNFAGPIDFAHAGMLGTLTHASHFDAAAMTEAGNLSGAMMQAGFWALRPTNALSKWVGLASRADEPGYREEFEALETWNTHNVPFPGAAYTTYIRELYQENRLVKREHVVRGERVDLSRIECPVLAIAADRDAICPADAAFAIAGHVGSDDVECLTVPGGHVGSVVGRTARTKLYPKIADWIAQRA